MLNVDFKVNILTFLKKEIKELCDVEELCTKLQTQYKNQD